MKAFSVLATLHKVVVGLGLILTTVPTEGYSRNVMDLPKPFQFSVSGPEPDADYFAWSPDGTKIAVLASLLRYVTVFDASTGKALARLDDLSGGGVGVAFSNDGKIIVPPRKAPGSAATIWDFHVNQTSELPGPGGTSGSTNTNMLKSLSVDFASNRLVGYHRLPYGEGHWLRIAHYDLSTGKLVNVGGGPTDLVRIAPGGRRAAASMGEFGQVAIYDLATMKELRSFHTSNNSALEIAWSAGGKYLATGTSGQGYGRLRVPNGDEEYGPLYDADVAQVWNAETGERIAVLKDVTGGVYSMDFSKDGRFLAVSDTSGRIFLYDANSLRLLSMIHREGKEQDVMVRFSPGSATLGALRTSSNSFSVYVLGSTP